MGSKKNVNAEAPVFVYMPNSKGEPSPALFAAGQYLAPKAHETQAMLTVNVERGLTLAECITLHPAPPRLTD